ncbi:MAG: heme A synthase [Polyangiaceae bacterium]|nr:heme A synthase [Polyangiaceae bacterium]
MLARRIRFVADSTLVMTLVVILWGAFVRASGSGAGCGAHWPMCNGEVVPRAPSIQTLVELTHRLTSGLALVLVVVLLIATRLAFRAGHLARKAAGWSLFFMITEALIGAGLVLYEKVAHDQSIDRGAWMAAHLCNTLLLLGALGLTSWAVRRTDPPRIEVRGRAAILLLTALGSMMLVGVTGAIAALGDTLFPSATLAEGIRRDFEGSAHLWLQLRVLHPFVASAAALHLLIVAASFLRRPDESTRRLAAQVGFGAVTQVALGVVNLLLAAPIPMQIVHLLAADLLWLALVGLTASALSSGALSTGAEAAQPAISFQTSAMQATTSTTTTKT